jgi:hypothetical protein
MTPELLENIMESLREAGYDVEDHLDVPDAIADLKDALDDAMRYRWLRDECVYSRRVAIAELATTDDLLDHHIDKGMCGLFQQT